MATNPKTEYAIEVIFSERQSSTFGKTLEIQAGIMVKTDGEWKYPRDYTMEGELYLWRLYMTAYAYSDHPEYGTKGVCLNDAQYHGELGLRDMEKAIPVLRKIEKGMGKQATMLGRPESFGAHIAHFAAAIGACRVLIQSTREEKDITGENRRNLRPGDSVYHLNGRVTRFFEENAPKVEAA